MLKTLTFYPWHVRPTQPGADIDPRARDWRRDPLSHPDIARMSERERADLPFAPDCILPD